MSSVCRVYGLKTTRVAPGWTKAPGSPGLHRVVHGHKDVCYRYIYNLFPQIFAFYPKQHPRLSHSASSCHRPLTSHHPTPHIPSLPCLTFMLVAKPLPFPFPIPSLSSSLLRIRAPLPICARAPGGPLSVPLTRLAEHRSTLVVMKRIRWQVRSIFKSFWTCTDC